MVAFRRGPLEEGSDAAEEIVGGGKKRRTTMMTGRGCAAGAQLTQWHGARGGPQSARVFGILNILEAIWVGGFWSSVDTVTGKAPKWGHQKVTKGCLCTLYRVPCTGRDIILL